MDALQDQNPQSEKYFCHSPLCVELHKLPRQYEKHGIIPSCKLYDESLLGAGLSEQERTMQRTILVQRSTLQPAPQI